MHRRRMLAALIAAPLAAHVLAQDARVRVVGYLVEGPGYPRNFARRMGELGFVEGRNLRLVVVRVPVAATGEQLARAAGELIASGAEVLVATGAAHVQALQRATQKLPIVSGGVAEPVTLGVAKSLRVPGMNVTGLSYALEQGATLQFGALRLLRPRLRSVLFVIPRTDPGPDIFLEHAAVASSMGITTEAARVQGMADVERALDRLKDPAVEAAWIDILQEVTMKEVAASAIRRRLVTHGKGMAPVRDGLLLSYWPIQSDSPLRIATIVDKVLRGADPATIPFELPDRTELLLNRATAAAVGVSLPEELLLRANQVFS